MINRDGEAEAEQERYLSEVEQRLHDLLEQQGKLRDELVKTVAWLRQRAAVLERIAKDAEERKPYIATQLRAEVARLKGRASLIEVTHSLTQLQPQGTVS